MPHRIAFLSAIGLFGLLLGGLVVSRGETASAYFSRSWLADEGLPTSSASDVVQDPDGFLWISTPEGVVRFDGIQFKSFSSPLIAKAAAQNIRALAINTNGAVLMLPALGGVVELHHGQFRSHPSAAGLEGVQLRGIFVERSGAIWLEIEGGRIRRWHAGQTVDYRPAILDGHRRDCFALGLIRGRPAVLFSWQAAFQL
jgi:ligand-binding sensor domain-containing protein